MKLLLNLTLPQNVQSRFSACTCVAAATLSPTLFKFKLKCIGPHNRYLEESEPFDRGYYSGPFGWISGEGAEFVVAIRSALVQDTSGEAVQVSSSSSSSGGGGGAVLDAKSTMQMVNHQRNSRTGSSSISSHVLNLYAGGDKMEV